MNEYLVRFTTTLSLTVRITADDEDAAAELAHERAEDYLMTVVGDSRGVTAEASLDGQGEDSVEATA